MKTKEAKSIYIAGPITGHDDCNRPAFDEAEKSLGPKALNPLNNFNGITTYPWYVYMGRSVYQLVDPHITHVVMLPGWTKSRGAQIEWLIAVGMGKTVKYKGEQPTLELIDYMETAEKVVYADRQPQYGHPRDTYGRVAMMKELRYDEPHPEIMEHYYKHGKPELPAQTKQVIIDYILGKISREYNQHKDDNLLDIAGYAICLRMLREQDGE